MPDQMMTDDDLRVLFTDLRVEVMSAVYVPGTGAARDTVRRRQATLAASTTGLSVLALVTMAFIMARPTPGDPSTAAPTGPATASVSEHQPDGPLDAAQVQELSDRAAAALLSDALTYEPEFKRGDIVDGAAVAKIHFPLSSRAAANSDFSSTGRFPTERQIVPAGSYNVHMRCAGSGKVHVRLVSIPDGVHGSDDAKAKAITTGQVMCTPDTTPYLLSFALSQAKVVRLEVTASEDARERAGFAYQIARYSAVSDQSLGNATWASGALKPSSGQSFTPTSVTLETSQQVRFDNDRALPAESLGMACAGPGTVKVSVATSPLPGSPGDSTNTTRTVPCHTDPVAVRIDANLHGRVTIDFVPDDKALNRAGLAYLLPF